MHLDRRPNGETGLLEDETGQGRRTLGVIDGTLTQVALAALLLAPTIATILIRPNLLKAQIDNIQDEGHRGVVLAPGPLFAFGFLSILVFASFSQADGAMIALGENVFAATTEGQLWRAAALIAPLFFAAICLGLVFFISAVIWRLRRRTLQSSVRAGLYALFGLVCVVIAGEPISTLVGPGGENGVFEPAVAILVAIWMAFFHVRTLSEPLDNIAVRVGAALTATGVSVSVLLASYLI